MNHAALERLAQLLTSDEPVLLNRDERELIRATIASLVAGERRAERLESLLRVHEDGLDAIENAAHPPSIQLGEIAYDYAQADRARESFREALENARDASSIVAAALALARDAAVLAS